MTDVLKAGLEWLQAQQMEYQSRTVSYRRGPASLSVVVIPGKTDFSAADEFDATLDVNARDYLIKANELILDNVETRPEPGDIIEDTIDGEIFEVYAPGRAPEWKFSDKPYRGLLRVHVWVMDESRLRHEVVIERGTATRDRYGGGTSTWETLHTCRASIEPGSGGESVLAQVMGGQEMTTICIPYHEGIRVSDRVSALSRVFDVNAVLDIGERHKKLKLICKEAV